MGRVDTNEHREGVLMESRFQEGPAGQSTFTDITSTPLPRRGLVGGRGGWAARRDRNYSSCVFREGSYGKSQGGGGITTKGPALLSSSSATSPGRGCKTRLLQWARMPRFPYRRYWTGTTATTLWFSCRPHLRSPVRVKHTNRPTPILRLPPEKAVKRPIKESGESGRSMRTACPLTQLSHRPHSQPARPQPPAIAPGWK